jgi:hypothetical protein
MARHGTASLVQVFQVLYTPVFDANISLVFIAVNDIAVTSLRPLTTQKGTASSLWRADILPEVTGFIK